MASQRNFLLRIGQGIIQFAHSIRRKLPGTPPHPREFEFHSQIPEKMPLSTGIFSLFLRGTFVMFPSLRLCGRV